MTRILAADCGHTITIAALIEYTGGQYRLAATGQTPSTYGPPWNDITFGVQQAIRHIEQSVGRTILSTGGWPITAQTTANQGVDAFVVVSSAGAPLSVLIAGLMQDVSLAGARRAVAGTYAHVTNIISLDAQDHHRRQSHEARILAIQDDAPEMIMLVGGTDGGAEQPVIDIAKSIAIALHLWPHGEKPGVLFAGNSHLRPQLADILGPITALTSVNNIRPTLDIEDLAAAQMELENLFVNRKMLALPGFDKLSKWTKYPVIPAGKSFEKLIAYLGRHNNLNVIGVNVGSGSTAVTAQTRQHFHSAICSDAGLGHTLAALLKAVPVENFRRWLPFALSPEDLYDALLNKALHPATIPATYEDLMIEHAVAREAIRYAARQTQINPLEAPWNLVVGAGRALTGTPAAGHAAITLIDGLEPWGVTTLTLDKNGLANMLGLIATVDAAAAAQVVAQEALLNLGTVIAPAGHRSFGKPVMTIKLNLPGGETVEKEIMYGSVEVINLPPGQKATLKMRPARHFDIGLGEPGREATAEVEGGILGIIFDARGRPLRLPADDEQRQAQLQQWLTALQINLLADIE